MAIAAHNDEVGAGVGRMRQDRACDIDIAGNDALAGAISVGAFAMIYFLANQIIRSVQELSYRMLDYFEQVGTLAEALELVSQKHEIADAPDALRWFQADRIHPNAQAHPRMLSNVWPELKKLL